MSENVCGSSTAGPVGAGQDKEQRRAKLAKEDAGGGEDETSALEDAALECAT